MVQTTIRNSSQIGRQVLLSMEQGQGFAEKIPEDPRTLGQRISTGEILADKSDRSRQGIQHPHGLLQTPRATTSHACKILRARRASKGDLSRRRQRNWEDVSDYGFVETDAHGGLPRRCVSYTCHLERVGCLLGVLREKYSATRSIPRLRKLRPVSRLYRRVPELRQKGERGNRC